MSKPVRVEPGVKLRDADKMALIPVKFMPDHDEAPLPKPDWMRIRLPATSEKIQAVKNIMRKNKLHSVCEEASCPNLSECFNHGTATFMILGAICTRRCPFCDVAHGRPLAPDAEEPLAWFANYEDAINVKLLAKNWIAAGQTWRDLNESRKAQLKGTTKAKMANWCGFELKEGDK